MLRGLDEERAMLRAAADGIKNRTPGPRRVLISGAPGTGKTELLRAAAADSGLKALVVAGSDFVEIFLGTGAKRVRELFEAAKKQQPVMVVIEDLDAIAKARIHGAPERSTDERDQTLVELCQWLDGLKKFPDRVLLVATTNRVDLLDPAITRPGRFELHLQLEGPAAAKA
jgi:AFG3 family protein